MEQDTGLEPAAYCLFILADSAGFVNRFPEGIFDFLGFGAGLLRKIDGYTGQR